MFDAVATFFFLPERFWWIFKVSGASLGRVLTVREERIEKPIDTIENERFQNRDFSVVGFGQF